MHCLGKEYRVVCTQTPEQGCQIDIVPSDQALHQLILKERLVQNKATKILAGSISLYDMGEGNRPEILFLPPQRGGLEHIELLPAEENRLRYKITQKFNEMMANNQSSTITVRPEIHQEYVRNIITDMASEFDAVLSRANTPQSLAEETNLRREEQARQKERTHAATAAYRANRDAKYSPYHLTALQIKQLLSRGD